MLKAAGLLLMVAAGTGYGFSKSMELTRREQALRQFWQMAIYLKGEIRHGNASLYDAFMETGRKMPDPYGEFLRQTAQKMKSRAGLRLGKLFCLCAEEYLSDLPIVKEEREAFLSLGTHLGYLDLTMQIKQLELYEREAEYSIEKLQAELPAKKKAYQSLGILGGLMLAVLFL